MPPLNRLTRLTIRFGGKIQDDELQEVTKAKKKREN
jgi:hypothetical protein